MVDVADTNHSPRDNGVQEEGQIPAARVTMTKNGGTQIELQRKGRQSTKLSLTELDGDLADLLTELDMDGDGQINAAELTRAMQIIKNEREGVQMWKKFVVIMGTVLAVSLLINICITLYGIYYVVVSTQETKVKDGYLMGSGDDDTAESSRRRKLREDMTAPQSYRDVDKTQTEEYKQRKMNSRQSVKVAPRGNAVSNFGVEDMFPFCKRGTRCEIDNDAMSVYAMNMNKLNVNTFGSGTGVRGSSEVHNIDSVWIFQATHEATQSELTVQCLFVSGGANVFYKTIEQNGDPEGFQGGPIWFKLATRDNLAEHLIIHMIFQDKLFIENPAAFTSISQPTAASIIGPALANPNNINFGIDNDWFSGPAFMFGPNRCTVTSEAFQSVCEASGPYPEPLALSDVTQTMSKEEKFEKMVVQQMDYREAISRSKVGKRRLSK